MPNTHSLKAGDKVRCIRTCYGTNPAYVEGHTYVVRFACKDSISTVLDERGSATNGWGAKNFELVTPAPPKYRVTETDKSGNYIVQRRVETWHTLTSGVTKDEAQTIADALNAREVA